ncbi:MAG: molybdopterin-dependent oxidoreductase [Nitrososphaeraceae archaeon]
MSQKPGGSYSITLSFIAGLAAGAVAITVSLLLRLFIGGLFIPELASQTLFSLTPGQVESRAVETLGPLAKYSAFIGAVVASIILYGLIGLLFVRLLHRSKKLASKAYAMRAIQSSVIAYIILLVVGALLLALAEIELEAKLNSIIFLAIYLIPSSIAFGFTLSYFYQRVVPLGRSRDITPEEEDATTSGSNIKPEIDYSKRLLLRASVASAVALPIIYFGLGSLLVPRKEVQQRQLSPSLLALLRSKPIPPAFEDSRLRPLLESEITPTDLFYRIDKNPIVPEVNAQTWNLSVRGLVDNPLVINYKQLRDMPSVEEFATLECVSNKIGGDLISTAVWKGVRLKDLLDKAHVKPSSKYIVFRCYDGYDVGIPLERGLFEGTILAYDMNSAPLTSEHGYPVRAIVPGIYGMMNAKWITQIELVDTVYEGYWQRKGWTNKARYNTHSFIIIPGNSLVRKRFRNLEPSNVTLNEMVPIAGMAFAGDRGIAKVEVSTDGGASWKYAKIKEPLSQYTWVLWNAELDLALNSKHKIVVRATDKAGNIQTDVYADPFPNGAIGYDTVNV